MFKLYLYNCEVVLLNINHVMYSKTKHIKLYTTIFFTLNNNKKYNIKLKYHKLNLRPQVTKILKLIVFIIKD